MNSPSPDKSTGPMPAPAAGPTESTSTAAPGSTSPTPDIELPACFYLGREYDLENRKVLDRPVMYDARDLTTHGVVVGMTGSGKTGLCISLLEEAAIDGIPCILIDPKGDLTNLLLQFPDLAPADFQKWLNPEDARQKGLTLEEYGQKLADKWRQGLAESLQSPERINRLREASEWRIYTPGSEAGLPLSVLQTFAAPPAKIPREALNQKIDATTTALLGLTGIAADPVQSREHILIAQILLHEWTQSRNLDLAELIAKIQTPPMDKIGAFDVDTFYPEKDRLKLAVSLNNILAAPSFSTWINGDSLDLATMLASNGKPRHLIFYIAHLEDSQRMFFLTLLLEEVLSWTRKQPGTTSLRAILYFDEVFGYLPPHPANPPTKLPLMTLLKQARAFGVGILLATQNPVDLDYKALSNAGTWFVGKLQTDRDKARLVEGLEGVAAERGTLSSRPYLETVISALENRIFLLHDVHKGKPLLFQSRHALCFLRGPLTRDQVALLMEPAKEASKVAAAAVQTPTIPVAQAAAAAFGSAAPDAPRQQEQAFKENLQRSASPPVAIPVTSAPPDLPADIPQVYLPLPSPLRPAGGIELVYQARLLGVAEVAFIDKKKGLAHRQNYRLLSIPPAAGQLVNWQMAESRPAKFAASMLQGARWADVPETLNSVKKLRSLEKSFNDFLYDVARLTLLENDKLELVGQPGEDVLAFRERCRATARQLADQAVAEEKLKYQPRFEALGARIPERSAPPKQHTSMLDFINPLWWLGFAAKEPQQIKEGKVGRLEAEWLAKQSAIYEKWRLIGDEYTDFQLTPRRQDVQVTQFAIAWVPAWTVK